MSICRQEVADRPLDGATISQIFILAQNPVSGITGYQRHKMIILFENDFIAARHIIIYIFKN